MAKLNILKDSDPTLHKISRPVDKITPRVQTLLDDMAETMRAADGCGLAAVQVGVLRRIALVETEEVGLVELINPVIINRTGVQHNIEGCLSFPGEYGYTERPQQVTVRAQNRNGEFFEVTGTDLTARAFCHEIDHLDGVVFKDHARMLSDEELKELFGDD